MSRPPSPTPEHHTDEWVRQRPGNSAEDTAQCQETPAGEDDSDTDLTYGEVEQRLDLLQQHLNRCGRAGWPERTLKQRVGSVRPKHMRGCFMSGWKRTTPHTT